MKLIKQIFACIAIASMFIGTEMHAYDIYGAVWVKKDPKTSAIKNTLKVVGDLHGTYFPGGDKIDIQSTRNIQEAQKRAKVKPCWVGERQNIMKHKMENHVEMDSEEFDFASILTLSYVWNKLNNKQDKFVVKKQPNLFSKKDFVLPRTHDGIQKSSPYIADLRTSVLANNITIPYLSSLASVIEQELFRHFPPEQIGQITEKIFSISKKLQDERDPLSSFDIFSEKNPFAQIGKELIKDFNHTSYKAALIGSLKNNSSFAHNFSTLNHQFITEVNNQMLACEEILKYTKDTALLDVMKSLYNHLQKTLIVDDSSIIKKFFTGADLSSIKQTDLENEIRSFFCAFTWDLADFGFLAKAIQLMPFAQNVTIYAGYGHIVGIEKLLQQAGYECVWSKYSGCDTSLSQKDLETLFNFNLTDSLKSKL